MVTRAAQSSGAGVTLSVAVPEETRGYLEAIASDRGQTAEEVAMVAIEEFVRMARFPEITFVDSPAYGRKAVVAGAGEVWGIVFTAKSYNGDLEKASEHLRVPIEKVRAALAYYEAYPEETDVRLRRMREVAEDPQRLHPSVQVIRLSDLDDQTAPR
jgi:hypothetical protein